MNEQPPARRIRELEDALKRERGEREKLAAELREMHETTMATSDSMVDLEDSTYALVAQTHKAIVDGFRNLEARTIARTHRARKLSRRSSMESRVFWAAIAMVAIVGVLVGLGKLPAAAFEGTAVTLIGAVGALVARNHATNRKEDAQEDAQERVSEPPAELDSLAPPPRRKRRQRDGGFRDGGT